MQILKDLSELCKKASVALSDEVLRLNSLKGEVEALDARRKGIEADVKSGLEELKNVNLKVTEERKRQVELIDTQSQDASAAKALAEAEVAKQKAITVDLQNKTDAAAQQRADAEALIASLKAQQATMDEKLAKIDALKAAIK